MIKIKKNLKDLQTIVKIVENMSVETSFVFKPEGIFIKAIHSSNTCIVVFEIDKSFFEEYEIKEQSTCTLDNSILSKVLNKLSKGELTITIEEASITFSNSKNKFSLNYYVSDEEDKPYPETESTSKWKVNSKEFFETINNFGDFGDNVTISGDDKLTFKFKNTLVCGETLLQPENIENNKAEANYGLEWLSNISKISDLFESLNFGFADNNPCVIVSEKEGVKFKWILACRVDNE